MCILDIVKKIELKVFGIGDILCHNIKNVKKEVFTRQFKTSS